MRSGSTRSAKIRAMGDQPPDWAKPLIPQSTSIAMQATSEIRKSEINDRGSQQSDANDTKRTDVTTDLSVNKLKDAVNPKEDSCPKRRLRQG